MQERSTPCIRIITGMLPCCGTRGMFYCSTCWPAPCTLHPAPCTLCKYEGLSPLSSCASPQWLEVQGA